MLGLSIPRSALPGKRSTMSSPTTVERTIVLGACPHDCPDTCSMLITVENGRAIEVRGNPDHPFTRGGLCVKVNNYTDRVYSPDRVLYPLRRTGPKGSRQFERISWEAALQEISSRFKQIIAEDGPQAILPCSYLGTEGILNGLNAGDAFFNKLGASISERTYCDSGACVGYIMTVGPTPGTEPESFIHSKYIILWACNTISTNLHHWPIIAEAQQRGAKVVVIDPLRNRTAQSESPQTNPAKAMHYPLNLLSPKSHAFLNSGYGNLSAQQRVAGEQYLTIHPEDANKRGITDGHLVRIFNDRGSFQAVARVSERTMPGVVVAPLGYWRKLSRSASTVNMVNSSTLADLGNAPTFSDTLVEVAIVE